MNFTIEDSIVAVFNILYIYSQFKMFKNIGKKNN
jgi:hypothetical protein